MQQVMPLQTSLKWKLALYDDPVGLDAIMLLLDQTPLRDSAITRAYEALKIEHETLHLLLRNSIKLSEDTDTWKS